MIYFISNQTEIQHTYDYTILTVQEFKEVFNTGLKGDQSIDLETTGFDPHVESILSFQIGNSVDQYVLDWAFVDHELLEIINKRIQQDTFLFQNAKFDLKFLYKYNLIPKLVYDTYLAEAVLTKGIERERKSLDYLCQKYLKIHLDKSIRGNIHREGLTPRVIKYAADDVKYLHELREKQTVKLEAYNLLKDLSIENKFVKALAYIEYCGFYLDQQAWRVKIQKDNEVLKQKEEVLNTFILENSQLFPEFIDTQLDLFSDELTTSINWSSPMQVIKFFHKLDINTKTRDKKTGEEKHSVEADVLELEIHKHPIVEKYLEFKSAEKVVTTYGENFIDQINPITGRLHTQFSQIMSSGRTSSGGQDKQRKIKFINFQNIPADKETRKCFKAQEGNTLIVADYSSQEAIVLVNESLEPRLLEFYRSGENDMHSYVAREIYPELKGLNLKDIKKLYPEKRQTAKIAGFALVYGAEPITISVQCKIPLEDAQFFYDSYMAAFSGLKDYFKQCHQQAFKDGYILIDKHYGSKCFIQYFEEFKENQKKLTREFWEEYREEKLKDSSKFNKTLKPLVRKVFKKRSEIERTSVNYRIQGISSRISKVAGILLFDKIIEEGQFNKAKIVNFVHDELIVEVGMQESEKWAEITQECMEKAGTYWCKTILLKAVPLITNVWTK